MTDTTKTGKKDLQTAITELVLELKGDGKIETLAGKLKMSRNRLAKVFKSYQAQMRGEKLSATKTPFWGLDTLDLIAQELKIHVSDIIIAAEDVQEGLPPWFRHRISEGAEPSSRDRFANILDEALGCGINEWSDPLKLKGRRKSLKYLPDNRPSEDESLRLKIYTYIKLNNDVWDKYLKEYCNKRISDAKVYFELKRTLDEINHNEASLRKQLDQLQSALAENSEKATENSLDQ